MDSQDRNIDELVKSHPAIKKFKTEAKELKKNTSYSLMQAQTIVAKNNGFNNWHDLLQKIKLLFNQDFKYNKLLSLKKNEFNADAYLHLGTSLDFGLEQWINHSAARTHLCIFEEKHHIKSLDLYFLEQMLVKKDNFIFIDYDKDLFLDMFLHLPIDPDETIQFDFTNYENSTHCISLNFFKKSDFIDFFQSFFNHDNEYIKNQFCVYVSCVVETIEYLKNNLEIIDNETIPPEYSLDSFLYFGQLDILKKYQHFNKHCEHFFTDNQFENLLESSFLNIINQLLSTGLFNPNKPLYNFLNFYEQSSQVFILTEKNNLFHYNIIWGILKKIATHYFDENTIYSHKKNKNKVSSILFHNPIIPSNIGNLPSQLRAMSISLIFNFDSDYPEEAFFSEAMNIILANVSLPIFFKSNHYYMTDLFIKSFSQYLFVSSEYKQKYKIKYHVKDLEKLKDNEFFTFFKGSIQKIKLIKE